jgi:hypothetical protein
VSWNLIDLGLLSFVFVRQDIASQRVRKNFLLWRVVILFRCSKCRFCRQKRREWMAYSKVECFCIFHCRKFYLLLLFFLRLRPSDIQIFQRTRNLFIEFCHGPFSLKMLQTSSSATHERSRCSIAIFSMLAFCKLFYFLNIPIFFLPDYYMIGTVYWKSDLILIPRNVK